MAEGSNQQSMTVVALGVGALLLIAALYLAPLGGGGGDDADAGRPVDAVGEPGEGGPSADGPDGGADGSVAPGAGQGDDANTSEEADQKAEALADDQAQGPVGEVTALSLTTESMPAPDGTTSLIAPRFSPGGKWLLATAGKQAGDLWVARTDALDKGWSPIFADAGLMEPSWLAEEELVVVMNEMLTFSDLGGVTRPALQAGDEVGRAMQPAASPDGSKVAWVSVTQTNHGGDIRVLDRATGVVTDLTKGRTRVLQPAWRQDGQAIVGTVDGEVTAWDLDESDPIARHPRVVPALVPGWWGDRLQWQEGSFAVNLVVAEPDQAPRILARKALGSMTRPAPSAGGMLWVASITDPGTLWGVRPDGSGLLVDTDAAFASQPDAIERADGVWLAFTSNDDGVTRIHVGRLDGKRLVAP